MSLNRYNSIADGVGSLAVHNNRYCARYMMRSHDDREMALNLMEMRGGGLEATVNFPVENMSQGNPSSNCPLRRFTLNGRGTASYAL